MHNILITGGAGFIGSHLCTEVLKTFEVNKLVALDNLMLGTEENLTHLSTDNRMELVIGDINTPQLIDSLFEKHRFDLVFHLAANSDISISHNSPSIDYDNTFNTTWNVLEAMRKYDCKRIVFASTSAIYGDVTENIHEDFGPLLPISHYGAGKLASEAFLSSFSYNYGIQTYIFRFPNVVGGRSTHGVIYDFINKVKKNKEELTVLGNGQQEKSYLHVSDLVNAILYLLQHNSERYNIFNVGGIDTINVARIAELVLEELEEKRNIVFTGGDRGWIGDVPKFKYDIQKILSTGWKPVLSSEMAVRQTVRELINSKTI
ncbi:NAD-dependent epimerase/dehydratase family protein [Chitinophaga sp. sic0106]|uniref:NAD-dependent epimerase/dehydratase family protein n=1 Tax=Chitinophaga sp. sic0106 TaxID=2854785 RepID=UPI001C463537|nr:NAD-dependent epimerase/dehydratase family protein [Chitinophaga sp. sic0106]MBV7529003.1 NAD-dependent epimerase/dehydratase family protein [Chitinophaga sp. sic0106]